LLTLRLRQASAGRVAWLAPFQIVALILIAVAGPAPTAADRLRLVVWASIASTALLSVFGAVTFAARTLPGDREGRQILTILAAPVSRTALAASTVVGSAALALGLAVFLSAVSAPVVWMAGDEAAREEVLSSASRIEATSFEETDDKKTVRWDISIDPSQLPDDATELRGRIDARRRPAREDSLRWKSRVLVEVEGGAKQRVSIAPREAVGFVVPIEIARTGRVIVRLSPIGDDFIYDVARSSVEIEGRRRSAFPEYALAAMGAGLAAAVIAAIAAAFSVFVSAPVGGGAALCIALVSWLRGFLGEAIIELRNVGPRDADPSWLQNHAAAVINALLSVVPDFGRYEALTEPLRSGWVATAAPFGTALFFALVWTAGFAAFGAVTARGDAA